MIPARTAPEPLAPQNLDAEESVLGAVLLDREKAVPVVREILEAVDFYRSSHGAIYAAMLDLDTRGEPVDVITVADELVKRGEMEAIGGKERLDELVDLGFGSPNFAHHARIVREKAVERRKLTVLKAGVRAIENGEPVEADTIARTLTGSPVEATPIKIVTLDEFVGVTEDIADPLIGEPGDSLLPADGLMFVYGDGGAGKTTLSIDALVHLASGTPWLGNHVAKPVTVLIIENEGPRGPFREAFKDKIANWQGSPFRPSTHVLEEPWARFTLDDNDYRTALARQIDERGIDLIIVGPLASLGAKGAGTPDDVTSFSLMLSDLRDQTVRPFALWIVHHENKSGDVSGAWARLPDTLVHVSAQGNGRTRVHWLKVRWSSRLHNTSVYLLWDNGGFILEEARVRNLSQEILDSFQQHDEWRTARETATLISANQDKVREELHQLVIDGKLQHREGPPGRKANAKCWRLRCDSDELSHTESQDLFSTSEMPLTQLTPPYKESAESRQKQQQHTSDSDLPSQITSPPRS
jgi:DnaB-like helicase N terminal domain/AAA domain